MDKTTQAVQQQIAAMGAQVFEADDADLARHKQELIQYMAWRSGERTMNAYEHVQRGRSFALRMQAIHREMEKRERHTIQELARGGTAPVSATSPSINHELAFLLGDDDDD